MYKRRIKVFMGIIAAVLLVLIARLLHLQVLSGDEYRKLVADALEDCHSLPPATRGKIMDRRGEFLAIDMPCHDLCLDYRFLSDDPVWSLRQKRRIARQEGVSAAQAEEIYARRVENTWRLAAQMGNVSRQEIEQAGARIVRRVNAIRDIVGADVREQREAHAVLTGLGDEAAAALKSHLGEMLGAVVRPGHIRYYPHGALACHVVGVTGQVDADEQKRLNLTREQADQMTRVQENYLDGDMIGKMGVEKMCESALRSKRGFCRRKRQRDGYAILEEVAPQPGQDVRLTIDHRLQRRLTELYVKETSRQNLLSGAREGEKPSNGAIVILSVPQGEVLAMVSIPTYDLNRYRGEFAGLAEDKTNLPLLDRAIGVLYPTGSTAKPMTALAGLAEGVIGVDTTLNCEGSLPVGRSLALHCWTYWKQLGGHGALNVTGALMHSCNIFFYQVGARLGMERLSNWFAKMGFAEEPGTGLPQERAGSVPTKEWLAKNKPNYRLMPIDPMQVAIGQGFLGATPLHVAGAMAAIARGGEFVSPTLIREGPQRPRVREDLGIKPFHVAAVVEGMRRVVNEPGGTAYKVFHDAEAEPLDVEVYGKTGTATAVAADLNGDGRIDEYERERNEMAWFAGFALEKAGSGPQRRGIAFAVVVEYVKGGGGQNAGPIAREAIRAWRQVGVE